MDKPKRPRGRPSASAKAKFDSELKKYEEHCSNAFVEAKIAEPHQKRKLTIKPDEETLRTIFEFAKIDCPQREIAAVLHVSEATFQTFMKIYPEAREAWEDGREFHKIVLRADQIEMTKKNAAMGIFRGKNKLGQKDESHTTITNTTSVSEMTLDQLHEIAFGGTAGVSSVLPKAGPKQKHVKQ